MKLEQLRLTTSIVGTMTRSMDLVAPQVDIVRKYQQDYGDGTGIDQAQFIFSDTRPLAATTAENVDLSGALANPLGSTLVFSAVKELLIHAADTNVGNLKIGEGIANAFVGPFGAGSVGIQVPPGGLLHLSNPSAAGWAVTGGSGDLLKVENLGAGSASYDIIIVGEGTAS